MNANRMLIITIVLFSLISRVDAQSNNKFEITEEVLKFYFSNRTVDDTLHDSYLKGIRNYGDILVITDNYPLPSLTNVGRYKFKYISEYNLRKVLKKNKTSRAVVQLYIEEIENDAIIIIIKEFDVKVKGRHINYERQETSFPKVKYKYNCEKSKWVLTW